MVIICHASEGLIDILVGALKENILYLGNLWSGDDSYNGLLGDKNGKNNEFDDTPDFDGIKLSQKAKAVESDDKR